MDLSEQQTKVIIELYQNRYNQIKATRHKPIT